MMACLEMLKTGNQRWLKMKIGYTKEYKVTEQAYINWH